MREYLGSASFRSSARGAESRVSGGSAATIARAEPVTLFADTGATYAPPATVADRATVSRLEVESTPDVVWP